MIFEENTEMSFFTLFHLLFHLGEQIKKAKNPMKVLTFHFSPVYFSPFFTPMFSRKIFGFIKKNNNFGWDFVFTAIFLNICDARRPTRSLCQLCFVAGENLIREFNNFTKFCTVRKLGEMFTQCRFGILVLDLRSVEQEKLTHKRV